MKIVDLKDGDIVYDSCYLVNDCRKLTGTKGDYLTVTLQDNSGIIEAKKWNCTSYDESVFTKNNIVIVHRGSVKTFNTKLQLTVDNASIANKSSINYDEFVLNSPIPKATLVEEFEYFRGSIQNKNLKLILDTIYDRYKDYLFEYPAASRNHHEFHNGLLYHSVGMAKLADQVAKLYNDVDRDLLITGCLLHDLGKIRELSGIISTCYTTEGILNGHISIGAALIREISDELKIEGEEPMLLVHMILSHHGKLEYGSPVVPHTREALLLSMIDDLDAKMMILDKAYKNVEKGTFTDRIFPLDNVSYYKKK